MAAMADTAGVLALGSMNSRKDDADDADTADAKTSDAELRARAAEKRKALELASDIDDKARVEDVRGPTNIQAQATSPVGVRFAEKPIGADRREQIRADLEKTRRLLLEKNARTPECSAGKHYCTENKDTGCKSCARTCHKDCTDPLCSYQTCSICLSLGFPTHVRSDECVKRHSDVDVEEQKGSSIPAGANIGRAETTSDTRVQSYGNAGASCYINAALQALFAIPSVQSFCHSHFAALPSQRQTQFRKADNRYPRTLSDKALWADGRWKLDGDAIFSATYQLSRELAKSSAPCLPQEFLRDVFWRAGQHQDPHEFICKLLDSSVCKTTALFARSLCFYLAVSFLPFYAQAWRE